MLESNTAEKKVALVSIATLCGAGECRNSLQETNFLKIIEKLSLDQDPAIQKQLLRIKKSWQ
jgi:hypothetical protein